MRVRLIVNPKATGVRGPVLDAVVAQLERVCVLEVVETERAGHAADLARDVAAGAVVGVGGDGTANEVANGVRPGVLMGVLPAGASSVFARHLGFPRDTVAAGGMMAEALRQESTRSVGLGVADDRRFTFAAPSGSTRRPPRRSTAFGTSAPAATGQATSRWCRRGSPSSARRGSPSTSG